MAHGQWLGESKAKRCEEDSMRAHVSDGLSFRGQRGVPELALNSHIGAGAWAAPLTTTILSLMHAVASPC